MQDYTFTRTYLLTLKFFFIFLSEKLGSMKFTFLHLAATELCYKYFFSYFLAVQLLLSKIDRFSSLLILPPFSHRLRRHDTVSFFSHNIIRTPVATSCLATAFHLFWLATRTIADASDTAFVPIYPRGPPSTILRNLHFVYWLVSPTQAFSNVLPVGGTLLADLIIL